MKEDLKYIIDQIINNEQYTFDSCKEFFHNKPDLISDFKNEICKDELSENHDLIKQYILLHSNIYRVEIFDELCMIHRKPFLTHKNSLSRVLIANEEIFLHIIKNDKRFFKEGPEKTSVDKIEEKLCSFLSTFYPNFFPKDKKIRKKEIYDALEILEDKVNPPLITTTRLKPGTGFGQRKRKRYCLTEEGFDEIVPFLSLVIRDQLEDLRKQI